MPINYTALKTELTTDPRGYGYAPLVTAGNDTGLADMLNLVRAAISIKRADVLPSEILQVLSMTDMPALANNPSSGQQSQERRDLAWLECLTNLDQIRLLNDDGTDTQIRANLARMFPAGTGTRTRLLALETRAGSRAEELFGAGTAVGHSDIATALRAT